MSFDIQRKEWAIVLLATRGLASFVANAIIGMERCGVDTSLVELVFPANAQSEFEELSRALGAQPRILEEVLNIPPLDMPYRYVEYGSPEFSLVEKYRFPVLRAIMNEGKRVIYSDVDVAWMRNPIPYLSEVINNYSLAMQTEALPMFPPMFCLGFFAMAGTASCFRLIDQFMAKYSQDGSWTVLQPVFRDMLVEKPKLLGRIFPLPESLFPNGLLRCVVDSGQAPPEGVQGVQPFIFHANWVTGIEKKRQLLKDAGVWFAPKGRGGIALRGPIPLFSADEFRLHNGAEVKAPDVRVITREEQWSYAVSFMPDRPLLQSIRGDQEIAVGVELRVDEGAIGVGLLRSDGREFIAEKIVRPTESYRTITLRAPSSEQFSEVIVRNCFERGKSRATVRRLETRLLRHVED